MKNIYIRIIQDMYSLMLNPHDFHKSSLTYHSNVEKIAELVGQALYPDELTSDYSLSDLDEKQLIIFHKTLTWAKQVIPDADIEELKSMVYNVDNGIKPFIYTADNNELIICSPFLAFLLELRNNKYEDYEDFEKEPQEEYDLEKYFTQSYWNEKVHPIDSPLNNSIKYTYSYPGEFILKAKPNCEDDLVDIQYIKIKELVYRIDGHISLTKPLQIIEDKRIPAAWVLTSIW